MIYIIVFVIGVIIIIANWAGRTSNTIEQSKSAYEYAKQTVEKEGIIVSKELHYNLLLTQKLRILIDDSQKKMHIFYMNNPKIEIPYDKIMGCEIYHNGTVVGSIKRAIAGGIIAGGAGAVVGAMTANKTLSSIGLKINQNDIQTPVIILPLIDPATDGEAPKDAKLCQEALSFANEVIATINVILKQTTEQAEANYNSRSHIISNDVSNSHFEEIKQYKELLDLGIITKEEFEAKKRQLLGN